MRQALAREDLFIVGIEVAMTDSMDYADVILPACTHFEHADVYAAYGQQYLQRSEAGHRRRSAKACRTPRSSAGSPPASVSTMPPSRPSDAELMDAALDPDDPRMRGLRPSELPLDRALSMEYDGAEPVLFRQRVADARPAARSSCNRRCSARATARALPDLPAGGFALSADADHAGLRQAHHFDFRRPRGQ